MKKLHALSKPVSKSVRIPGSKSATNRALVMAALSDREVRLKNYLTCDDTEAMIHCLKEIGFSISQFSDYIVVGGDITSIDSSIRILHPRLSGTTMRFLTAMSVLLPGKTTLVGSEGLNKRPIRDLIESIKQIGAEVMYEKIDGFPPITITSPSVLMHSTTLQGSVSSQYCSALLMVAPLLNGFTLDIVGAQISKSYIDITLEMMNEWGVQVENHDYKRYDIPGNQKYKLDEYTIEGDYSSACYFAAIAALTHSSISLSNLKVDSTQGDRFFFEILKQMGNEISYINNQIIVKGRGVKPLNVDMEMCPDQAQTLAVLAAFAQGKTVMTGVRSLRVKETERVKAVQSELAKMNIKTESPDDDTLIVFGGNPSPAAIDTWGDHRMAMSFAVAGTKLNGMNINHPEVVNKTFPEFWHTFELLYV